LEVAYVHGREVSSLPANVRLPSFPPTTAADGSKALQLGRHAQQQWFEALLEDPVHRNSISRVACEVMWTSHSPPTLRTLGSNLLVVDSEIVQKDQAVQLSCYSQIRFMFQSDGELADLLMLVVNPSTGSVRRGVEARVEVQPPTVQIAKPQASSDSTWGMDPLTPSGKSTKSVQAEDEWWLELVYACGLSGEDLVCLPSATRTFLFELSPSKPSAVFGRQHNMAMFEALLKNQKDLLAFVSRSHLQLELADEGQLTVTNLSQNISMAGDDILVRGSTIKMGSGDPISFLAQAENVPGTDAMVIKCDGVERNLAPFLTFRLVKSASASPRSSSMPAK